MSDWIIGITELSKPLQSHHSRLKRVYSSQTLGEALFERFAEKWGKPVSTNR